MRISLVSIAILFVWSAWAQLDSRSVSHDFGDILEKNGRVEHDFDIRNFGEDTIEIVIIESSCGCTSFVMGEKKIGPGQSTSLKVFYDPKDRPGRFHKTVRIRYQYMNFGYEAMYTVRGNVIREENDQEVNKITDLKIQPFDVLPVSEFDTSFAFLPRLEEFINGITYEIDLHGFAVLAVDHTSYTISNEGRMDELITRLKKRIARGLVERGYKEYQVTWRPTEFDLNFVPDWAMSRISIYSTKYTSKEVYFYQVHRETKGSSKDYSHLFWTYKSEADTFDQKTFLEDLIHVLDLKMMMLDSRQLKLSYHLDPSEKLKKKSSKIQSAITKTIEKNYGKNQAVVLEQTTALTDSKSQFSFKLFETLEEKPQQKVKFVVKEAQVTPPLLPMAHYDLRANQNKKIDTSDVDMKRILTNAIIHMEHGRKIVFNIESSMSHYPQKDGQNALFHARKNSRNAHEIIKSFMRKRGVDENSYSFNQLPLVQGPEFSKKYDYSFYKRFEYLNILPTFDAIDTAQFKQIKYMVNFNSNAFTLDSNATMFKVFMNGIIAEINQLGYAKIILESSSSKAPTRTVENYTNDVISYKRAEETRDIMKNYLKRSGIDPNRLILLEERCLVQGPEYELDYFENKEKYKQFQYIKIIPHRLLSE
ncbi:MAG: DUF1573 domain-containing protein [Crocinitomicaceae bacterium]|nr:DUF1573 domain-containing protein [Crocinitomicaceae bacterium]